MKIIANTVCNYGIIDYSLIFFFPKSKRKNFTLKIGDYYYLGQDRNRDFRVGKLEVKK